MTDNKPDDRERAIRHYTASIVGEYVAGQVRRDFIAGADWDHARALKEMGAERPMWLECPMCEAAVTPHYTIKEFDDLREQLAAAQGEIERLNVNWNKWNVREAEEALAAAERELGDLKASMWSWEVAKEIEILANSDKQWNELITQRDAYEKALENIPSQDGISWSIARKVLKAHTRPTKEAADE